jgi:hypothetical protein
LKSPGSTWPSFLFSPCNSFDHWYLAQLFEFAGKAEHSAQVTQLAVNGGGSDSLRESVVDVTVDSVNVYLPCSPVLSEVAKTGTRGGPTSHILPAHKSLLLRE